MNHAEAIKRELSTLSDSDRERFERIRAAQIAKHGSEMPKQLHGALHTIRRAMYQRQEWRASAKETLRVSATLVLIWRCC